MTFNTVQADFSNVIVHRISWRGDDSELVGLGGEGGFAFLISSHVKLMLLAHRTLCIDSGSPFQEMS